MKGLKLSKLVSACVPIVASLPPLGAAGLTHSKCAKSAAYLRSPKAESPWRGASDAQALEAASAARPPSPRAAARKASLLRCSTSAVRSLGRAAAADAPHL